MLQFDSLRANNRCTSSVSHVALIASQYEYTLSQQIKLYVRKMVFHRLKWATEHISFSHQNILLSRTHFEWHKTRVSIQFYEPNNFHKWTINCTCFHRKMWIFCRRALVFGRIARIMCCMDTVDVWRLLSLIRSALQHKLNSKIYMHTIHVCSPLGIFHHLSV